MIDLKLIKEVLLFALGLMALTLAGALGAQAQQASTAYRRASDDPFEKRKLVVKKAKPARTLVTTPPIQARIQAYKQKRLEAMNASVPAPKPTTALLTSEVNVTAIYRTPRGYAATVEAAPIKLSYVIYPGEVFYDGMLVAIEENRLVFRKETRWSDGRRDTSVELKPLGATNAVKDALTASNGTAANDTPAAPSKKDEAKLATSNR